MGLADKLAAYFRPAPPPPAPREPAPAPPPPDGSQAFADLLVVLSRPDMKGVVDFCARDGAKIAGDRAMEAAWRDVFGMGGVPICQSSIVAAACGNAREDLDRATFGMAKGAFPARLPAALDKAKGEAFAMLILSVGRHAASKHTSRLAAERLLPAFEKAWEIHSGPIALSWDDPACQLAVDAAARVAPEFLLE